MSLFNAILFIILLITISAIVSSSEIAFASARKIKLQVKANKNEHDIRALEVLNMQENPSSFITVVQVILNAVAILAGVIGEFAISPHLFKIIGNQNIASLSSFLFVTSTFILLADIIPKRLAMSNAESIAIKMVRPMMLLIFIFKPLIWIFENCANFIFKLFGISAIRHNDMTSEEIVAVMDAGAQAGIIKQQEHYLIDNIFEMQTRTVTSAMTNREQIIYFSIDTELETIVKTIIKNPHHKFLVCSDDNLEKTIGYIESRKYLALALSGKEVKLIDPDILKTVLFMPDTLSLFDALEMFKSVGSDFAVIVNEYTLVVGIITLKDVMNIVMGELVFDEEQLIVQRDSTSWLIDGMTPIEDVMRILDIYELPNNRHYETLSGFMMAMLRKIPKKTDILNYEGYSFEVLSTVDLRINQLLVTKVEQTSENVRQEDKTEINENDDNS